MWQRVWPYKIVARKPCMSVEKIIVVYHPESLEGFDVNGHRLRILGAGRTSTPGHPVGNQQYASQLNFLKAASTQRLFPVYHRVGVTETYMGEYSLVSFRKKESFEGFTYFLFTLHRKTKPCIEVNDYASLESTKPPLSSPVLPEP